MLLIMYILLLFNFFFNFPSELIVIKYILYFNLLNLTFLLILLFFNLFLYFKFNNIFLKLL